MIFPPQVALVGLTSLVIFREKNSIDVMHSEASRPKIAPTGQVS